MERCKAKRIVKPIVYGNTASLLLKKREEDNHTHEWTVFVKPYYVEDLSKFIRKVQFKLHESYSNPSRSNFFLFLREWGVGYLHWLLGFLLVLILAATFDDKFTRFEVQQITSLFTNLL